MFYGLIHRGLDRWGGAFFCGSAAVLRRKALDSVGGFAGETITEDAETALEIHSAGWKSAVSGPRHDRRSAARDLRLASSSSGAAGRPA